MGNRIEDFAGTEEEYVKFLEQKVHKLVAHHHKCTLTRPTWGPGIDTVRTTNLDCTSPASTLTFVPWNEHVRSKNRRRETPEWQHKADILVQKTQQFQHSAEWNAVCEAMCTDQAAAFLIDENYTTPHPSNVPTSALQAHRTDTVDVIELLRMYAQNTIKRGAAASMATMFASFQKFILLSSCAVLYYSKSSMEVLDIVRICIGSDATERYCVQVLNTTKYIHRLVDTLNSHGWGTRASVLLLVWNFAPPWYYAMASSPQRSIDYLRTTLPSADIAFRGEHSGSWKTLDVPILIRQVLGRKYEYDDAVCPEYRSC